MLSFAETTKIWGKEMQVQNVGVRHLNYIIHIGLEDNTVKIFLSYGHDYQEEAAYLTQQLKSMGYDVWIDYEGIAAGDDWRDKITENILNSDYILALLSQYGLRENGVCLNELAIALGCNRRNIRPVKMEQGVEMMAPAAIMGIQFFDLSDWRKIPETQFENWFSKKISELVEVCFTRAAEYEQKLQIIKDRLHYAPDFSRELFDLGGDFQRRNWLDDILYSWVNENRGTICLLIGFPGFGKSCFCTNLYYYSMEIAGLVICKRNASDGIAKSIREISFQLAARIPAFATQLERVLNTMSVSMSAMSNKELFDHLLMEPLNIIDGNMETAIIVVDGVDIYSSNGENELIDLFYEKQKYFPRFIRFIFTARKDDSVISGSSDVFKLYVAPDDERVFNDIRAYVSKCMTNQRVDKLQADSISRRVATSAQGSFLYASVVSNGLKTGSISPEDVERLPCKVADVYYRWLKQIVPVEEYARKYCDAISLLVALDNPPVIFLKKALGWRRSELQSFLRRFSVLFVQNVNKQGEACVSFYCNSFEEWIKDETLASQYAVYEDDGIELAAEYMISAYENSELTDYDYLKIISVLKKSGKRKAIRDLGKDSTFFDCEFEFVEQLQKNPENYEEWNVLLDELSWIYEYSGGNLKVNGGVPYYRAKGEFICGDLIRCGEILDASMARIETSGESSWYLDSLYMAGTIFDYKGARDQSVAFFQKLLHQSENQSPENTVRALAGLIWNDHFNNLNEGFQRLNSLKRERLNEDLILLSDLIKARMLLSSGQMEEALALFEHVLNAEEKSLWKCDIVARKNQMLVIESIVAAYDCGKFSLAVEYAERIYAKLGDTGGIPECYCLSWLSLSYYKQGQTEKAKECLNKAKIMLGTYGESKSLWLEMHLLSIEAKYFLGDGDGYQSAVKYKEVEKLAELCGDIWVRGAACFNIVAIDYYMDLSMNESDVYAMRLFALSELSQLPHLLYKAKVIKLLFEEPAEAAKKISEFETVPSLPDVDKTFISRVISKKAQEIRNSL